jgi:hypothetical protein
VSQGDWIVLGVLLPITVWVSLIIDPGWKDARKDVAVLDRVVHALDRRVGRLWRGFVMTLKAINAIWYWGGIVLAVLAVLLRL